MIYEPFISSLADAVTDDFSWRAVLPCVRAAGEHVRWDWDARTTLSEGAEIELGVDVVIEHVVYLAFHDRR